MTIKLPVTFQNYFVLSATPGRAPSDAPIIVNVRVMPSKPDLSLSAWKPLGPKLWGNKGIDLHKRGLHKQPRSP
jgi:hypothetical protein